MRKLRLLFVAFLFAAVVFGGSALLSPVAMAGKDFPPGGGIPPNCPCDTVIQIGPNVCVLAGCFEVSPGSFLCFYDCT